MLEIILNPDKKVEIPLAGTFCAYRGKEYEILSTTTYQEKKGDSLIPVFTTICLILEVTDEGDDAGEPTLSVNSVDIVEL